MRTLESRVFCIIWLSLLFFQYTAQSQITITYHSKSSKSGYNYGLVNGNNFDNGNNYYNVIKLSSNTFQVGDTTIVPVPNETRSAFYSVTPSGKVRYIKFCQGTNTTGIFSANVVDDKVYMIQRSFQFQPLGLFDGTQIPSPHYASVWISVFDTNGNHLVTKEVCHSDSTNSYFYNRGMVTANKKGEIFISSYFDGYWDFQGVQKYWKRRTNKYGDAIRKNIVIKLDSNANIFWINDSINFTGGGVRQLHYSEVNQQLITGNNFSDTLWLPDGSIKKATDPVVVNANSLFFAAFDTVGAMKWCTHYNSGGADVPSITSNADSSYNVVIATGGNKLKIDGDSLPWLYYAYIVNLDNKGKSKFLYGATSDDYNYYITETNGQNDTKFLNFSCTKTSYALQDSSMPHKPGLYFTTIWHLKDDKILGRISIKGNTAAGGSFMYQIGSYTYLQVGGNDSIWINDFLIKADTGFYNSYFVLLPNSFITGIEPAKQKKSLQAMVQTRLVLYPNPANNKVTATWQPGNQYPTQVSICDGMGNALLTQTASAFTNVIHFETGNLKPGLYFVLFENKLWKEGRTLIIKE